MWFEGGEFLGGLWSLPDITQKVCNSQGRQGYFDALTKGLSTWRRPPPEELYESLANHLALYTHEMSSIWQVARYFLAKSMHNFGPKMTLLDLSGYEIRGVMCGDNITEFVTLQECN